MQTGQPLDISHYRTRGPRLIKMENRQEYNDKIFKHIDWRAVSSIIDNNLFKFNVPDDHKSNLFYSYIIKSSKKLQKLHFVWNKIIQFQRMELLKELKVSMVHYD